MTRGDLAAKLGWIENELRQAGFATYLVNELSRITGILIARIDELEKEKEKHL